MHAIPRFQGAAVWDALLSIILIYPQFIKKRTELETSSVLFPPVALTLKASAPFA